jgi:cytochrome c553
MTTRSRSGRLLRVLGITLGILVAVALVGAGAAYALSARRLGRVHAVPEPPALAIPTDSASIARGRHLATIATCVLCHGTDLGGSVYSHDPMLGTIAGPNLTSGAGGIGGELAPADWVRAIRHGVRRDGTSLIVMPSEVFVHMGETDLAALIAYLEQLPPVDREVPRSGFGPVGRALLAAGKLDILVAGKTPRIPLGAAVAPAPTVKYGRYLADFTGCHGCHGYGLSGGRVAGPPGLPPASNLTPAGAIAGWSEADFARALREGRRPDGSTLDEFMPWRMYSAMTDEEVRALWLYLKSVPSKPFGNK